MKQCNICKETKELIEFNKASTYKDKVYYRSECRPCNLKMQSSNQSAQIKYRNSEKGKTNKQRHKKTDKYLAWQRKYENNRYASDNFYKIKKNLRRRLLSALKASNWRKGTHFADYIGCDEKTLRDHLEKQFIINMSWSNYGFGKDKWTVDHIIPLSSAKTEEEMYKLCHYTNLQPMWYIDNIKKGNK